MVRVAETSISNAFDVECSSTRQNRVRRVSDMVLLSIQGRQGNIVKGNKEEEKKMQWRKDDE